MHSQIFAAGSAGTLLRDRDNPFHQLIVEQTEADTAKIGFLPTAGGDNPQDIIHFYNTYNQLGQTSHLQLFERQQTDLQQWFEEQDLIWVGGGNTANALLIWRLHGVDQMLRAFCQERKVVAGGSAGGICWFEQGMTDSFGDQNLQVLDDGLGVLPGSLCPHYLQTERKLLYHQALLDAKVKSGYAVHDMAALWFENGQLKTGLSCWEGHCAYTAEADADELLIESVPMITL